MRNSFLVFSVTFLLQAQVLFSQTSICGSITPSANFDTRLYIFKVSNIDLQAPILFDSIPIKQNGTFSYTFKNTNPQDLIYKIFIPVREGNRFHTYGTVNKNFFYITTEGNEQIEISASADSLFYSLKVKGGRINSQLHTFVKLQKPFYTLEVGLLDSIAAHPEKEFEYKQNLMPKWVAAIEQLKPNVTAILDSAKSSSTLILGLQLLFETNFGKIDKATTSQYLNKIKNKDLLVVRNTYKLIDEKKSNRVGTIVTNVPLSTAIGKKKALYDIKSRYILMDFWASWCSPCRYANRFEMPQLHERYKDDVKIIGLSIDTDYKKWKVAVDKDKTAWEQYIDKSYILKSSLDVQGVPVYILLDEQYKVVYESMSIYEMDKYLEELVLKK